MTQVHLSRRDVNVLEKIKDPESNPAAAVVIDPSLPRDPHVVDPDLYDRVVQKERAIIRTIQSIETQLSQSQAHGAETAVDAFRRCLVQLDSLVAEEPRYASARNNRAQVIRRLYGDSMLLNVATTDIPLPLIAKPPEAERRGAAAKALEDLEGSIALLSPATIHTPVSPQAARTLSMAHTQRAAIYLKTSKLLSDGLLDVDDCRPEVQWTKLDFEEAASRDLAHGGRYGNQIAKGLAVSVNPTAKLCGQIVREAMLKEYGASFKA